MELIIGHKHFQAKLFQREVWINRYSQISVQFAIERYMKYSLLKTDGK